MIFVGYKIPKEFMRTCKLITLASMNSKKERKNQEDAKVADGVPLFLL